MFPLYFLYDGWVLFILRLVLGSIFIAHGWPKIKNLNQNGKNFDGMGFKPGMVWGTIAALLEFFGGIGLILGIFVMTFAVLYIGEFVVILLWRIGKGHHFVQGWELDLLILAGVIVLFALGAGPWSFGGRFMLF